MPKVKALCMSENRGIKFPVESVLCIENFGIKNDYHAKADSDRQISILLKEHFDSIKKEMPSIEFGAFGENIIIEGICFPEVSVGDTLMIGDCVKLEVTKIGKDCPAPCIIYQTLGRCIMPEFGIFTRVLEGGVIQNEDICTYCKR